MINWSHVSAGFSGVPVLQDISGSVAPGRITCLIGPNGAGKSTLLKATAGILPLMSGDVFLDDQSLSSFTPRSLAHRLAYLPQSRSIPEISVFSMVLHGRFSHLSYPRRYTASDREIVWDALRWVHMEDYAEESVSRLSGGQRQKVYIAMALVQDAQAILLDEPTTFLDIKGQLETLQLLRQLALRGKEVLVVLHNLDFALRCGDDIILLDHGTITQRGTPSALASSDALQNAFGVSAAIVSNGDQDLYTFSL